MEIPPNQCLCFASWGDQTSQRGLLRAYAQRHYSSYRFWKGTAGKEFWISIYYPVHPSVFSAAPVLISASCPRIYEPWSSLSVVGKGVLAWLCRERRWIWESHCFLKRVGIPLYGFVGPHLTAWGLWSCQFLSLWEIQVSFLNFPTADLGFSFPLSAVSLGTFRTFQLSELFNCYYFFPLKDLFTVILLRFQKKTKGDVCIFNSLSLPRRFTSHSLVFPIVLFLNQYLFTNYYLLFLHDTLRQSSCFLQSSCKSLSHRNHGIMISLLKALRASKCWRL